MYYADIQYSLLLFIVRLCILIADHITAAPAQWVPLGGTCSLLHHQLIDHCMPCTFIFSITYKPFSVACSKARELARVSSLYCLSKLIVHTTQVGRWIHKFSINCYTEYNTVSTSELLQRA